MPNFIIHAKILKILENYAEWDPCTMVLFESIESPQIPFEVLVERKVA